MKMAHSQNKAILPFEDKHHGAIACITGASSGIGMATARHFASKGFNLLLLARRKDKLKFLEEEIRNDYPVRVLSINLDVCNQPDVDQFFTNLPNEWQLIDVLINNAGKAKGLAPFQEGNMVHWEEMIDTNLKGLIYVSRAVIPVMVARNKGFIINIGSIAGRQTYPNGNVYCASKAAVQALTEGMRMDLHTKGIRVASISPGHVEETEFALVRFDGDTKRAKIYDDFQPLKAGDIADILYFMVSRPAHVTLQDVVVMSTQQPTATLIDRSGRNMDFNV